MSHALRVLALAAVLAVCAPASAGAQTGPMVPGPSFREVVSLRSANDPRIAPDGRMIAYTVQSTEWENNRYDTEIWISKPGEEPVQLTNNPEGNSEAHRWRPDGRYVSFVADHGDGSQLFLVNPNGGAAVQLTDIEGGVGSDYQWSPDGSKIAFTLPDPESEEMEKREELYGDFAIKRSEKRMVASWDEEAFRPVHLRILEIDGLEASGLRPLTSGRMVVNGFEWSPDGRSIAFAHQPDPFYYTSLERDISVVSLGSGHVQPIVTQHGQDTDPHWSPDGEWVLFTTRMGNKPSYRNTEFARVPAGGGEISVMTEAFDENPDFVAWTPEGVYFEADLRTTQVLLRLSAEDGTVTTVADEPRSITDVHLADDGATAALMAHTGTELPEVYRASVEPLRLEKRTDMNAQIDGWDVGTREIIEWSSFDDGRRIEGVLMKPSDFEEGRRYPLLFQIHGGPASTSRPEAVPGRVYPLLQFLAKGAMIVQPNYGGSTGYGEEFRMAHIRKWGYGDAQDIDAAIEHLDEEGMIDPEKVGTMGWSNGGVISAYLATHSSERYAVASVGAGATDWMTQYVNADIPDLIAEYHQSTPWEDPEIYARNSAITYIDRAQTPVLFQHGEFDKRVPIPNAFELYTGLMDSGVTTDFVIYKGFGHGISKPKERLAAIWHNWQWFSRYIWGEEVEIPLE